MGIVAGKFVVGQQVVAYKNTTQPAIQETEKEPVKQDLKQYGKLKVGNFVNLEKIVSDSNSGDRRLSSYFVIPKDSDYLDHHKNS